MAGPSQADIASSLAAGIAAGILSGGNELIGKAKNHGIFDDVAHGISKMSSDGISAINDAANKATDVVNSATLNAKAIAAEIPDPVAKIGKSAQDAVTNVGPGASPKEIATAVAEAALNAAGEMTGSQPEVTHTPAPLEIHHEKVEFHAHADDLHGGIGGNSHHHQGYEFEAHRGGDAIHHGEFEHTHGEFHHSNHNDHHHVMETHLPNGEALQFVGSRLPIPAFHGDEGLAEGHHGLEGRFSNHGHGEGISAFHGAHLGEHAEDLFHHGEELEHHGEELEHHDHTLEEHGEDLQHHGEELEHHGDYHFPHGHHHFHEGDSHFDHGEHMFHHGNGMLGHSGGLDHHGESIFEHGDEMLHHGDHHKHFGHHTGGHEFAHEEHEHEDEHHSNHHHHDDEGHSRNHKSAISSSPIEDMLGSQVSIENRKSIRPGDALSGAGHLGSSFVDDGSQVSIENREGIRPGDSLSGVGHLGTSFVDNGAGAHSVQRPDSMIQNNQGLLQTKSDLPEIWGNDENGNFKLIDPRKAASAAQAMMTQSSAVENAIDQNIGEYTGPTINGIPLSSSQAGVKAPVYSVGVPMSPSGIGSLSTGSSVYDVPVANQYNENLVKSLDAAGKSNLALDQNQLANSNGLTNPSGVSKQSIVEMLKNSLTALQAAGRTDVALPASSSHLKNFQNNNINGLVNDNELTHQNNEFDNFKSEQQKLKNSWSALNSVGKTDVVLPNGVTPEEEITAQSRTTGLENPAAPLSSHRGTVDGDVSDQLRNLGEYTGGQRRDKDGQYDNHLINSNHHESSDDDRERKEPPNRDFDESDSVIHSPEVNRDREEEKEQPDGVKEDFSDDQSEKKEDQEKSHADEDTPGRVEEYHEPSGINDNKEPNDDQEHQSPRESESRDTEDINSSSSATGNRQQDDAEKTTKELESDERDVRHRYGSEEMDDKETKSHENNQASEEETDDNEAKHDNSGVDKEEREKEENKEKNYSEDSKISETDKDDNILSNESLNDRDKMVSSNKDDNEKDEQDKSEPNVDQGKQEENSADRGKGWEEQRDAEDDREKESDERRSSIPRIDDNSIAENDFLKSFTDFTKQLSILRDFDEDRGRQKTQRNQRDSIANLRYLENLLHLGVVGNLFKLRSQLTKGTDTALPGGRRSGVPDYKSKLFRLRNNLQKLSPEVVKSLLSDAEYAYVKNFLQSEKAFQNHMDISDILAFHQPSAKPSETGAKRKLDVQKSYKKDPEMLDFFKERSNLIQELQDSVKDPKLESKEGVSPYFTSNFFPWKLKNEYDNKQFAHYKHHTSKENPFKNQPITKLHTPVGNGNFFHFNDLASALQNLGNPSYPGTADSGSGDDYSGSGDADIGNAEVRNTMTTNAQTEDHANGTSPSSKTTTESTPSVFNKIVPSSTSLANNERFVPMYDYVTGNTKKTPEEPPPYSQDKEMEEVTVKPPPDFTAFPPNPNNISNASLLTSKPGKPSGGKKGNKPFAPYANKLESYLAEHKTREELPTSEEPMPYVGEGHVYTAQITTADKTDGNLNTVEQPTAEKTGAFFISEPSNRLILENLIKEAPTVTYKRHDIEKTQQPLHVIVTDVPFQEKNNDEMTAKNDVNHSDEKKRPIVYKAKRAKTVSGRKDTMNENKAGENPFGPNGLHRDILLNVAKQYKKEDILRRKKESEARRRAVTELNRLAAYQERLKANHKKRRKRLPVVFQYNNLDDHINVHMHEWDDIDVYPHAHGHDFDHEFDHHRDDSHSEKKDAITASSGGNEVGEKGIAGVATDNKLANEDSKSIKTEHAASDKKLKKNKMVDVAAKKKNEIIHHTDDLFKKQHIDFLSKNQEEKSSLREVEAEVVDVTAEDENEATNQDDSITTRGFINKNENYSSFDPLLFDEEETEGSGSGSGSENWIEEDWVDFSGSGDSEEYVTFPPSSSSSLKETTNQKRDQEETTNQRRDSDATKKSVVEEVGRRKPTTMTNENFFDNTEVSFDGTESFTKLPSPMYLFYHHQEKQKYDEDTVDELPNVGENSKLDDSDSNVVVDPGEPKLTADNLFPTGAFESIAPEQSALSESSEKRVVGAGQLNPKIKKKSASELKYFELMSSLRKDNDGNINNDDDDKDGGFSSGSVKHDIEKDEDEEEAGNADEKADEKDTMQNPSKSSSPLQHHQRISLITAENISRLGYRDEQASGKKVTSQNLNVRRESLKKRTKKNKSEDDDVTKYSNTKSDFPLKNHGKKTY